MDNGSIPQTEGSDINALLRSCSRQDLIFLNALLDLRERAPDKFEVYVGLFLANGADLKAGDWSETYEGPNVKAYLATLSETELAYANDFMGCQSPRQLSPPSRPQYCTG